MTTYTQLIRDVSSYVENKGAKFMDAMPTIVSQSMLAVCRALPLEMFNAASFYSVAPKQDRIMFSQIVPPIEPITVDHLIVHPYQEIVERRSLAYVRMHGGQGTPSYFCDIPGGLLVTPKPIGSLQLEITYMTRPELSEEEPSNWYTQNTYDLVLTATLIEAETYLIEPDQIGTFRSRFSEQIVAARRDHQDMLRVNVYNPLAIAAEPATKGGAA